MNISARLQLPSGTEEVREPDMGMVTRLGFSEDTHRIDWMVFEKIISLYESRSVSL